MSTPIEIASTFVVASAFTAILALNAGLPKTTPSDPPTTTQEVMDVQCELWLVRKRAIRIEEKLDEKAKNE